MIGSLAANSRRIAILMALTVLSLGIYCGQARAASILPTFALPNAVDGKIMQSSTLKGKITLINFFTTW
ncbi:MAG: hypothetical protein OEL66_03650 [Desulfobulbaceae bacterium]|nr:hypothetical protein [Desulfobulbaceae bacterium]